ncbi:MAG: hypothetical protein EZS28_033411 [Streblomastix strix]|uniref:Uncharacterized protein n=1 Tax=Streblomastix strix TaxID=222440 RepID=A0A5J4ULB1_9EUKA|nr:MAG: hypothetical protein EZS28_033411 [Streblomastix strix]
MITLLFISLQSALLLFGVFFIVFMSYLVNQTGQESSFLLLSILMILLVFLSLIEKFLCRDSKDLSIFYYILIGLMLI